MRWTALAIVLAACGTTPLTGDDDDGEVPFTLGTSTLAGAAEAGYVDGARAVARFANPVNVAYRDGQIYVADFDNGKIRVIDADSHETSTLIAQAGFRRPFGLAFGPDGTLFATTDNDRDGNHSLMTGSVWRIDVANRSATVVANAIGRPRGLGVLPDGTLVVADYAHHVIERIDAGSGAVTVLAGAWDNADMIDATGAAARFSVPYGLVVLDATTIVVADYGNHRLRTVTMGGVATTFAGTGAAGFADGAADTAMFHRPQALALAPGGDLYVTDSDNFRVRRIAAGTVTTIAGNGTPGYRDDDDPLASELYGLEGIALIPDGSMLYVADGSRGENVPYNRVRQIARRW